MTKTMIRLDADDTAALSRMLPELHEDAIDMLADTTGETNAEYRARLRAIMNLADQLGIDLD